MVRKRRWRGSEESKTVLCGRVVLPQSRCVEPLWQKASRYQMSNFPPGSVEEERVRRLLVQLRERASAASAGGGKPQKLQTPTFKLQRNTKLEIPIRCAGALIWSLGFGASLKFGVFHSPFPPAHLGRCLSWKSISPALGTTRTPSASRLANSSARMLPGSR